MENSAPRRFQKHPTPLSFGNMSMFRNICKDLKPHRLRAHPRTRVRYRPWEYGKADVAVDRLSQGKDARSWYCQSRENMTRPVVKKKHYSCIWFMIDYGIHQFLLIFLLRAVFLNEMAHQLPSKNERATRARDFSSDFRTAELLRVF